MLWNFEQDCWNFQLILLQSYCACQQQQLVERWLNSVVSLQLISRYRSLNQESMNLEKKASDVYETSNPNY